MEELAKRAVACKGWRWREGMRAVGDLSAYSGRVCGIVGGCIELALDDRENDDEGIEWHSQARSSIGWIQVAGEMRCNSLPDLTDPATVGCLMQMLRDAYPTAEIRIGWLPADDTTTIRIDDGAPWLAGNGATLAEALVAALEAAP